MVVVDVFTMYGRPIAAKRSFGRISTLALWYGGASHFDLLPYDGSR